MRDRRDVLQVNEEVPSGRLEQLVAGERQHSHLAGRV